MSKIRDQIENSRKLDQDTVVTTNEVVTTTPLTGSNTDLVRGANPYISFRNRIINGDFSVWQVGTSYAYSAGVSGYYTADMVMSKNNSYGQFTMSKSSINNKNAIRATVDTAVTDLTLTKYWYGFIYFFEGQHLYDLAINGKDITISFWFNANVTGEYSFAFRNETDGATSIDSYVTTFNYTTANTPQKVEITISLNNTFSVTPLNDENRGFSIAIGFLNQGDYQTSTLNQWQNGVHVIASSTAVNWGATAGNFWEIAELQLEEGNVATEFEYIPYDIQLMRCQIYYIVFGQNDLLRQTTFTSEISDYSSPISIAMRASPSVLSSSALDNSSSDWVFIGCTSLDFPYITNKEVSFRLVGGTTGGTRGVFVINTGWIALDARL